MNYVILCLIGGQLQVSEWKCPMPKDVRCWEVGVNPIQTIPAIGCGTYTPAGVFIPGDCRPREPKVYVIELKCQEPVKEKDL